MPEFLSVGDQSARRYNGGPLADLLESRAFARYSTGSLGFLSLSSSQLRRTAASYSDASECWSPNSPQIPKQNVQLAAVLNAQLAPTVHKSIQ